MQPERVPAAGLPQVLTGGASHSSTALDRSLMRLIAGRLAPARVRLTLWDAYSCGFAGPASVASILIKTRSALLRCAWDPELYFGDAYMSGEIDVEGDLVGAMEEIYQVTPPRPRRWWTRVEFNGIAASRRNVHQHYDLGNDFYRLWLDRELLYTCAYFPVPGVTLEEAQVAKLDLICRKLRLQPGDRVIEAGCGWGALALYMAREYGVTVRAFNVSSEQIAHARRRAIDEGLADRVEFVEDDYRNISGRYDRFVSVGMLEHVGLAGYPTFGELISRSLTADGRGLLHFIGRNSPAPLSPWIRRRIFPGAYPPALGEVLELVLAPNDFSVLDVENLRLHYAKTLEHWRSRFTAAEPAVRAMFDEPFVRAWRLYLAGAEASFATGCMQLFQVVFARGSTNAIPWTRTDG